VSDILSQSALSELADNMVPWPDDYVEELTPLAALLLCRQMVMAVTKVVTGAVADLGKDPEANPDVAAGVLNGMAAALAGVTHACVAIDLLPQAAEDDLG